MGVPPSFGPCSPELLVTSTRVSCRGDFARGDAGAGAEAGSRVHGSAAGAAPKGSTGAGGPRGVRTVP